MEDSPLGACSAAAAGLAVIVVDHDRLGPDAYPAVARLVPDLTGVRRLLLPWEPR